MGGRARTAVLVLAGALAAVCGYTSSLAASSVGDAAALAAGATVAAAAAVHLPRARRPLALVAGVLALAACLSFPLRESQAIVRRARTDSVGLPVEPRIVQVALSSYLRGRTRGLRYELAADDALKLAPLLIHDSRAILPLTSFAGMPLVGFREFLRAVHAGSVRYAFVATYPCLRQRRAAACVPTAVWVRSNGIDVSTQAGLPPGLRVKLYRLPR
jgi:hypothetical protein